MATQDILINWAPQETRVAIVENGAVQEFHVERALERGLVGNIYLGKVSRVLPGMQSAFVDIGLDRAAFLHVADLHAALPAGRRAEDAPLVPIERQVFEGQTLTVQVIKDPIGTKGARVSTQVSIAGRMLVHLPQDQHIGISQKIGSPETRDQLRARMQALVGTPKAGGGGGFILRTNAEEASDEELVEDIAYLRKTWSLVRQRAVSKPPGTLLHQDLSLVERVLRDLTTEATQSIRIDSRMQFEALQAFGRTYMPAVVDKLEHYRGERPIFDLFGIEEDVARALARRVDLKSGGYLIIDQTEALTTVDVNTGGFVGARNFDDTIFKTNLEAAGAIARQLRQRTRESLAHMLCQPCPTCEGRAQVKTPRSVCYDILREILREARQFNPREFRVVASAAVVEMMLDEESVHLAGLSEFIGKPISLSAEPGMNPEQYDIVLL
ncbi:MAG: Rne/Rng family ribonuclease [Rubrivivax sp.]|nr:Rne/Rng family ribonuclease [Rubrivivax sp.]